jgi:hypothetical protein
MKSSAAAATKAYFAKLAPQQLSQETMKDVTQANQIFDNT